MNYPMRVDGEKRRSLW